MNYRTNYAITTLALVMASAPALASRQCSDYLSGVNNELASSLSSASKRQLTGLGIGPKGELLVSNRDGYFVEFLVTQDVDNRGAAWIRLRWPTVCIAPRI